ncbi:hypothetical protein J5X84_15910 [Streptosporangiaceae bacterium NEAU-GS5]|nr:hypothetical protein [Streptosporangiaceae bacterium NEAU-GS5]
MKLLIVVGAAAAVVFGSATFSAAAAADPQDVVTTWKYKSDNNRAVFKATSTSGSRVSGDTTYTFLDVEGSLYNRDTRPASRGGLCAYVEWRTRALYRGSYVDGAHNLTQCDTKSPATFSSPITNPTYFDLRVCQIAKGGTEPVHCGDWQRAFQARIYRPLQTH